MIDNLEAVFTDNDVVKAFESLFKKLLNVKYDLKITRKEFLALNRVDTLIKRQQAEIERLEKEQDQFADVGKCIAKSNPKQSRSLPRG